MQNKVLALFLEIESWVMTDEIKQKKTGPEFLFTQEFINTWYCLSMVINYTIENTFNDACFYTHLNYQLQSV